MVVVAARSGRAACLPLARGEGRDGVDHGPAEPRQEPQAAGEIRDREVDHVGVLPGLPGDDRLDGELGHRLDEGEERESEALRHQELGGLGAPGDEERRGDHGRERPEGRARRARSGVLDGARQRRPPSRSIFIARGYSMEAVTAIASPANPLIREIARGLEEHGLTSSSRARRRSSTPWPRVSRSSTSFTTRASAGPARGADRRPPAARVARGPREARRLEARPSTCSPSRGAATSRWRRSSGDRARSSSSSVSRTPATSVPSSGSARRPAAPACSAPRARPTSFIRARCGPAREASCGFPCRAACRSSRSPPTRRRRADPSAAPSPREARTPSGASRLPVRPRRRRRGHGPAGRGLPVPRPQLTIPMRRPVDSLNAAVATALLLYSPSLRAVSAEA